MSDNIKIPFDTGWSAGITITKDLARQIVALGLDGISPKTLAALDRGMADSLAGRVTPFLGEAHQSELEKAHATPVDAGVAKDRRLSGVKILPSERNKNDWPQGDYVNQCCECKETFLGQKRSCACRACIEKKGQEHFTQPPVDAGGDDAAVVAIFHAWVNDTGTEIEGMRAILAAIRAGKVPNIVDATVLSDERGLLAGQYAEIAALRARLADSERRADEMEGKAGEWIAVDVHKERVRAAIADCKAMNERLLGERDAFGKEGKRAQDAEKELRARVAELENADADPTMTGLLTVLGQEVRDEGAVECLRRIIKERDLATSELERQARMLREATDERDRALADLAAERERTEAWHLRATELAHDPRADARPVIEEWRAKAERAWSDMGAARAEVAALKARNAWATNIIKFVASGHIPADMPKYLEVSDE